MFGGLQVDLQHMTMELQDLKAPLLHHPRATRAGGGPEAGPGAEAPEAGLSGDGERGGAGGSPGPAPLPLFFSHGGGGAGALQAADTAAVVTPPLPSRTNWTRLVLPPVLTGHASPPPLPQAQRANYESAMETLRSDAEVLPSIPPTRLLPYQRVRGRESLYTHPFLPFPPPRTVHHRASCCCLYPSPASEGRGVSDPISTGEGRGVST